MKAHMSRFSESARKALSSAHQEAVTLGHANIRPEHILLALFEGGGAAGNILAGQGVDYETIRRIIEEETSSAGKSASTPGKIALDDATKRLLENVAQRVSKKKQSTIENEDLLFALATLDDTRLQDVMEKAGLDRGRIRESIDRSVGTSQGSQGLSELEGLLETLDACRLILEPDSVHQQRLRAMEKILREYFDR